MRVLMVNPHDVFYVPSLTRAVELGEAFAKMNHEVTLFFWPLPEALRLYPQTRTAGPGGVKMIAAVNGRLSWWRNFRTLMRLARVADVIEFQKCYPHCAVPALLCAKMLRKPVCYDWDDNETAIVREAPPSASFLALIYALEKLIPRLCSVLTVASQALRDKALHLGVSEDLLFDAPVGANLERFEPSNRGVSVRAEHGIDGPLVMYMGQLQGSSYGDLFLKAVRIIAEQRPDAHFMLVGGGMRLSMLKSAAKMLGLQDRLIFTDYVPHETIPEYLAAADIAIATFASNETTVCKSPLKIVEYLAAGRPIVASDVGDVRRMVGDAGIIVPPDDAGAIAEAVIQLLDDEGARAELSQIARRRAEEVFNWDATARNMLRAFEKALEVETRRS